MPRRRNLLHDAADRIRHAGSAVSDCELPPVYAEAADVHALMMNAECARAMGWEMLNARDQLSAALREKLEWGLAQSPETIDAARGVFDKARRGFAEVTQAFDVLLTPSAPGEAPAGLEWTGEPSFNAMWTGLHVPCVTIPVGRGPHGLPLGLQSIGRGGEDRLALAAAHWIGETLASH